jgi:acyl-coenzyme A synthetase/AMP-(fatty) acid ligase
VLGRTDRQVKVNGVRICLEELEKNFEELLAKPCCAMQVDGQIQLAIESSRAPITVEDTAAILAGTVPAAMMPRQVVCVEALPRNRSGKIDFGSCLLLFEKRANSRAN